MQVFLHFRNPVYWQKTEDIDYEKSDLLEQTEEVCFISTVSTIDHPFDHEDYRKKRPMCDYPVKSPKRQIQGERGPRHYNKQTPEQQFAASVNLTVKSML